jgi:hypothetical protein
MSIYSIFKGTVGGLFSIIKGALMPGKKDFIGGLFLTAVVYLVFGVSVVLLLPLIIVAVFVTYVLRRLWKAFLFYWTIRTIKKTTCKGVDRIKGLFK